MLVAKDFRDRARSALSGKWTVAVVTGLVASLLGAYTALGSVGNVMSRVTEKIDFSRLPDELLLVVILLMGMMASVGMMLAIVQFIIGGAVTLGYVHFNFNLLNRERTQITDLFSQFDRLLQAFVAQLLRSLFIVLWTLLLIIPGIIATYSYAMTPYILYENPQMSAYDSIKASKELMQGNKWRLFCLSFSFIGWDILCIFTLGIGHLWLQPYREAAYAAFYKEIKAEKYGNWNA